MQLNYAWFKDFGTFLHCCGYRGFGGRITFILGCIMDTNALMCVYNIVAISVIMLFLVMRTYTVYVLYLSTCTSSPLLCGC